MPLINSPLDSRKHRLKLLHQRVEEVEQMLSLAKPIPTLRIRTCAHPECGVKAPSAASSPQDMLIIRMGCSFTTPEAPE